MIDKTLSHYEILEEISRGGMGVVYRARDVKLNRDVALKVLRSDLVIDDERKRRFVQEAQAAAALKHPNIAVVYEIGDAKLLVRFDDPERRSIRAEWAVGAGRFFFTLTEHESDVWVMELE